MDFSRTTHEGFQFCSPFQALEPSPLKDIKSKVREPSAVARQRYDMRQACNPFSLFPTSFHRSAHFWFKHPFLFQFRRWRLPCPRSQPLHSIFLPPFLSRSIMLRSPSLIGFAVDVSDDIICLRGCQESGVVSGEGWTTIKIGWRARI